MKYTLMLFVLCMLCLGLSPTASAQDKNYDELARKIVHTSVRIQPGDVVAVMGGKHMIPLMEAVAVEAQMQGGMVTLFLDSDRVMRSFYKDVPEPYLEQEPQYIANWLDEIDVWISLPSWENPETVFADIPEERQSDLFLSRVASLPGGQVFFAPVETSASGTVVVPKARCRYEPLTGVTFTFEQGRMQHFAAAEGEACFQETLAAYSGSKDRFGFFAIGLNPALKVMENEADYRPDNAAGLVWIGSGENQLLGGKNTEPGGFGFPITNATVEIDGQVVVKDGRLVLGTL